MNVKELKQAIKDLPDDMEVSCVVTVCDDEGHDWEEECQARKAEVNTSLRLGLSSYGKGTRTKKLMILTW